MYSALVLDHFEHPRNSGELPQATYSATIENPACGDILELSVRIEQGIIAAISFRAKGCVPAIACASRLTEMAQAKPRALKDAVGFNPSSLTQSASAPNRAPNRLVRTSGVQPSPKLTIEVSAGGSTGAYRHMLEGPLATSRRGQRCRMISRS